MTIYHAGAAPRGGFDHPALIHTDMDEFLAFMVPFIGEGIERDEPVFVAVGAEALDALQTEIGGRVHSVQWADTEDWHPHPARRLRAFYEFVDLQTGSGSEHVRLVGEPVWSDGRGELMREWQRYESILNHVLAPFPVTLVCTYDASRLHPSITEGAERTHPVVHRQGRGGASPTYERPSGLLEGWTAPLTSVPRGAASAPRLDDVAALRRFVRIAAFDAGLRFARLADLILATNEIVTNAVKHGAGVAGVRTWTDGDYFICQIDDHGSGPTDPFAGYRPLPERMAEGRGLWLARQSVDLVQIEPRPTGSSVRLWMFRTSGR